MNHELYHYLFCINLIANEVELFFLKLIRYLHFFTLFVNLDLISISLFYNLVCILYFLTHQLVLGLVSLILLCTLLSTISFIILLRGWSSMSNLFTHLFLRMGMTTILSEYLYFWECPGWYGVLGSLCFTHRWQYHPGGWLASFLPSVCHLSFIHPTHNWAAWDCALVLCWHLVGWERRWCLRVNFFS